MAPMHSCLIESTVRYAARAVTFYLTTARYVNQQFLDSGSWTVQEYPPSIFVTIIYAGFFLSFQVQCNPLSDHGIPIQPSSGIQRLRDGSHALPTLRHPQQHRKDLSRNGRLVGLRLSTSFIDQIPKRTIQRRRKNEPTSNNACAVSTKWLPSCVGEPVSCAYHPGLPFCSLAAKQAKYACGNVGIQQKTIKPRETGMHI